MKKSLAILAAVWLPMCTALSTMAADPMRKPDSTTVTESPKEAPNGGPVKPVEKKEAKPDAGAAKKPGAINTEAELETDCNSQ